MSIFDNIKIIFKADGKQAIDELNKVDDSLNKLSKTANKTKEDVNKSIESNENSNARVKKINETTDALKKQTQAIKENDSSEESASENKKKRNRQKNLGKVKKGRFGKSPKRQFIKKVPKKSIKEEIVNPFIFDDINKNKKDEDKKTSDQLNDENLKNTRKKNRDDITDENNRHAKRLLSENRVELQENRKEIQSGRKTHNQQVLADRNLLHTKKVELETKKIETGLRKVAIQNMELRNREIRNSLYSLRTITSSMSGILMGFSLMKFATNAIRKEYQSSLSREVQKKVYDLKDEPQIDAMAKLNAQMGGSEQTFRQTAIGLKMGLESASIGQNTALLQAMARIGISPIDSSGKPRTIEDIFKDFSKVSKKMTMTEAQMYGRMINLDPVTISMLKGDDKTRESALEKIKKTSGVSDEALKAAYDFNKLKTETGQEINSLTSKLIQHPMEWSKTILEKTNAILSNDKSAEHAASIVATNYGMSKVRLAGRLAGVFATRYPKLATFEKMSKFAGKRSQLLANLALLGYDAYQWGVNKDDETIFGAFFPHSKSANTSNTTNNSTVSNKTVNVSVASPQIHNHSENLNNGSVRQSLHDALHQVSYSMLDDKVIL